MWIWPDIGHDMLSNSFYLSIGVNHRKMQDVICEVANIYSFIKYEDVN